MGLGKGLGMGRGRGDAGVGIAAGSAVACMCMVFMWTIGIPLLFAGIVLTANYEGSVRLAGIVCLTLAIVFVAIGVVLIVFACVCGANHGTVTQTPGRYGQHGQGQTIVVTNAPVVYATGQSTQGYPAHAIPAPGYGGHGAAPPPYELHHLSHTQYQYAPYNPQQQGPYCVQPQTLYNPHHQQQAAGPLQNSYANPPQQEKQQTSQQQQRQQENVVSQQPQPQSYSNEQQCQRYSDNPPTNNQYSLGQQPSSNPNSLVTPVDGVPAPYPVVADMNSVQ